MFCQKCGAEINNEAVVCIKCGCAIPGKTIPGVQKEKVIRKGVKKLVMGAVGVFIITPICVGIFGFFAYILYMVFGWLLWAGVFEFFGWGNFFSFKVSKPIKILGLTVLGAILLLLIISYFSNT